MLILKKALLFVSISFLCVTSVYAQTHTTSTGEVFRTHPVEAGYYLQSKNGTPYKFDSLDKVGNFTTGKRNELVRSNVFAHEFYNRECTHLVRDRVVSQCFTSVWRDGNKIKAKTPEGSTVQVTYSNNNGFKTK